MLEKAAVNPTVNFTSINQGNRESRFSDITYMCPKVRIILLVDY